MTERIVTPYKHIGLSSATKPTHQRPGATFYEYDSGQLFITHDDGSNWVRKSSRTFGEPTLMAQGNGRAVWERGIQSLSTNQKGSTGWVAKLMPGLQASWLHAAMVVIPVNELNLTNFTSAQWTYLMTNAEEHGVNIGLFVHDPTDFSKRAEINQTQTFSTLTKRQGWNQHALDLNADDQFFFFGEGTGASALTSASSSRYSIATYQADVMFETWTIFKIVIAFGHYTEGVFEAAYIGEVFLNGEEIPLKPSVEEQLDIVRDDQAKAQRTIPTWTFGKPTLSANKAGRAHWFKAGTSPFDQKSATSWLADLYGGAQTGTDWARINIPINEMKVTDFTAAQWSYYVTSEEVYGVNIVIWIHDPDDFDKRAEVTQSGSSTLLDKGTGWNSHKFSVSNLDMFFYGEGTSGEGLTAPFTWAEVQADVIFSAWTIYRISLEWGWYSTGTFESAYVADISLNGELIPLYPDIQRFKKTVNTQKTIAAAAIYDAGDVMSESATPDAGTDWDFSFGATGKVVQAAVASQTNGLTGDVDLYLYSSPPTCELDDHAANTGPVVGDLPFFIGMISFAALTSPGGISFAVSTDLSLAFDTTTIYGVMVDATGQTFGAGTTLDITLTAELET